MSHWNFEIAENLKTYFLKFQEDLHLCEVWLDAKNQEKTGDRHIP
jgi:hypothetical protein